VRPEGLLKSLIYIDLAGLDGDEARKKLLGRHRRCSSEAIALSAVPGRRPKVATRLSGPSTWRSAPAEAEETAG
jgi:hypothetical protein